MVFGFGGSDDEQDVTAHIAKKNYSKAIQIIRAQLKTQRADGRLRLRLADVLEMAGRPKEAVKILSPLADEYANEGFAAKAVAVLKKVQKLDPSRRDTGARLAELIEQKQRYATVVLPITPPPDAGHGLEIGMEALSNTEPELDLPDFNLGEPADEFDLGSAVAEKPAAEPVQAGAAALPAPVDDQDLFIDDGELLSLDAEPQDLHPAGPSPTPSANVGEPDSMSDGLFAEELLSLVEDAFKRVPGGADGVPMPDHDVGSTASTQVVISPLFKDFSVDELMAVIQGLKLLTFEPRTVILREGTSGDSLYMLTAGTVKAYVKNAQNKQQLVGTLREGAFFGEVSILTGQPRTATVVAATRCELLELDRETLDTITHEHPHVRTVLEQFARERTAPRET